MSRTLIIEDEPAIVDIYCRVLRSVETARIEVVDNAVDAIKALDTVAYERVVSDYDLKAGTTGGDVLRYVRRCQPWLIERFVLITGNDDAIRTLGHHRAFDKPITTRQLRDIFLAIAVPPITSEITP